MNAFPPQRTKKMGVLGCPTMAFRPASRSRLVAVALLALFVTGTGALAAAGEGQPTKGEALEDRRERLMAKVDSLEAHGDFSGALDSAREIERLLHEDPAARRYEFEDVRRMTVFLEGALQLDAPQRDLVARGYATKLLVQERLDASTLDEELVEVALQNVTRIRGSLGGEHEDLSVVLHDAANVLTQLSRFDQADSLYREALIVRRACCGARHPVVAEHLRGLGLLCRKRDRYAEAESLYTEALSIDLEWFGEDDVGVATTVGNLGTLAQAQGDYARADSLLRICLETSRRVLGARHLDVATSLNNLGLLSWERGDFATAEMIHREALALRRDLHAGDHMDIAISYNNLALAIQDQGRPGDAQALFHASLAMRRQLLGDGASVVTGLINLASIRQQVGDGATAISLLEEALRIARAVEPQGRGVALTLGNLAGAHLQAGDLEKAAAEAIESVAVYRSALGDKHPALGVALMSLAVVFERQGRYEEADARLQEGLRIVRPRLGETHPTVVKGLISLANLARESDRVQESEELARIAVAAEVGRPYRTMTLSVAMKTLAWTLRARGAVAEAESVLAECTQIYEVARRRANAGMGEEARRASPYLPLAVLRAGGGGEGEEAWSAAERALGRGVADLMIGGRAHRLDPRQRVREDSLRIRLGDAERRLAVLQARGDSAQAMSRLVQEARNDLLGTQASWESLQEELARQRPLESDERFPLDRVQRWLGERVAIVGWLDIDWSDQDRESWGYVVRAKSEVEWVRLNRLEDDLVEDLRRVLSDPLAPIGQSQLQDVFELRIGPLLSHLESVDELVVLPSGPMLGVPVEALEDERRRTLGERFAVSYAPSATIYTWLREEAPPLGRMKPGLFVGDPIFPRHDTEQAAEADQGLGSKLVVASMPFWRQLLRSAVSGNEAALDSLPALPATRPEIEESAALFPGSTVLLGRQATEQTLVGLAEKGDLGSYRVLHFATHALTDDERPEQSALVLSRRDLPDALEAALEGRRVFDGLLTAQEIVREWKLDADLVVLSGCETGLGREVAGEGYIGLATGFLQAGARSALVSLWPVEDRSTSLLMRRFYENWTGTSADDSEPRRPMSKVRALQEAKAWLRTQYPAPFYWAGFILIGDPG